MQQLQVRVTKDVNLPGATLLMGDSGTGKTHFLGTALSGHRPLLITSDEHELTTLKGIDMPFIVVKKWEDMVGIYSRLRQKHDDYDIILIDNATDLQQRDKDFQARDLVKDELDIMLGKRKLQFDHWGQVLDSLTKLIVCLKELGLPLVMTCLVRTDESPLDGTLQIVPDLQGAIGNRIGAMFDIVGYTHIASGAGSKDLFCLSTQPLPHVRTKDRTQLKRTIIDPKYELIEKAFRGEVLPEPTVDEKRIGNLIRTVQPPEKKKSRKD